MALDCLTPLGRVAIDHAHTTLDTCERAWDVTFIRTEDTSDADVDAIGCRGRFARSVVEVKTRDLTLATLISWGTYLVTADKLSRLAAVGKALRVPGLLLVGLYPERRIVYWLVSHADGTFAVDFEVRRTETQRSVNGGSVERDNAYLPVSAMREVRTSDVPTEPSALTAPTTEIEWHDIHW